MKPSFWRFAPALGYMALLYYLSAQSSVSLPSRLSDKLVHLVAYTPLGLFWIYGLAGRVSWRWTQILALLFTALYGLSDEWHQSFVPGRVSEAGDVLADGLGGVAAVVLANFWNVWMKRRRKNKPQTPNNGAS